MKCLDKRISKIFSGVATKALLTDFDFIRHWATGGLEKIVFHKKPWLFNIKFANIVTVNRNPGLFRRLILHSGGERHPWSHVTPKEAFKRSVRLAGLVGCGDKGQFEGRRARLSSRWGH